MTKDDWLKMFDETCPKFKWIFLEYNYKQAWNLLMVARHSKDINRMFNIMNDIWFLLPDDIFNIMKKPKGWNEFLNLLEEDVV